MPRCGESGRRAVGDVDDDKAVAVLQQLDADVTADETGASRDENRHFAISSP